ncbi:MAG: histidine phosphatase family protein [Alphaproteobacteria bacterium]|nr:histidine phosphatase family protein [Alphaproteobacteria bacterium]MCB9690725.1 histidine phosphatase family protein [Alphaproteobacteria bacterium]
MRWTFLRHGESVANAGGWLSGQQDVPLTPRGRKEARRARDPLQDVPFARVVVSDLSRALETARLAAPHHALVVHPGLRERTLGEWDGRTHEELEAAGLKDVLLTHDGRPPGGESHADLRERGLRTLAELDAPVDTLVVAHGGILRAILSALDGLSAAEATRLRLPNTGIQTRAVVPGTWAALHEEHRAR